MKKMKRELVTEVIKLVIRNIDLNAVVDTATTLCHNFEWHSVVTHVQALLELIQ